MRASVKRALKRVYLDLKLNFSISRAALRFAYRNRIRALRNIHAGKRCFIIGNGPSLTAADLSQIAGEYAFAANRIYYIFDQTEWRPTFYVSQDLTVAEDCMNHYLELAKTCETLFVVNRMWKRCGAAIRKCGNILFYHTVRAHQLREFFFSPDVSRSVCDGSTVTVTSLQIAVYMGFSEIYLLGVDHNYAVQSLQNNRLSSADVEKSYFTGMRPDITIRKPNIDSSTRSFAIARRYAEQHRIKIYNATRGGKLEVFERIDFDDVLQRQR